MIKFLPKSFAAWVLIAIVSAVISYQVITLLVASYFVADSSRSADLFRLAERVSGIVRAISTQPQDKRVDFIKGLQSAFATVTLDPKPAIEDIIADDDEFAELEDILTAKLATFGVTDLRVAGVGSHKSFGSVFSTSREDVDKGGVEGELIAQSARFGALGYYVASMKMGDSGWVNLVMPKSPETMPFTFDSLYVYLIISVGTLSICVWAVYQLVAPYRNLERAVRNIGEDLNTPSIPERGSHEVRSVIRAINTMQARLKNHMSEREYLAAALAHDLRTPLTRIKIRCELANSRAIQPIVQDVREIEKIVNSVLEFSRSGIEGQPTEKIELVSLIQDVCTKASQANFQAPENGDPLSVVVRGNAIFLSRAITNLVDNAIRHAGTAVVHLEMQGDNVSIIVEDEGKGIPEAELENVLKPFHRLESSRNRETGGTGLGLSIADNIARAHKGTLQVQNRNPTGLRAIFTLPVLR